MTSGEGPGVSTAGYASPGPRGGQPGVARAVYLAHPIDNGFVSTRDVSQALVASGCAVFDPGAGWKTPLDVAPTPSLSASLYALMDHMDGVLALLPKHTLTIGTVLEVVHAARNGQPVVILSDMGTSWALAEFDVPVYADPADAIVELHRRMGGVS